MKKRKLILGLVVTLALLCGIVIGATASNGIQAIQASLDSTISVKLNGQTQVLKDANGTTIFPITYQGTTYLPIRAVSGLAGLDVDWDQASRSVLLGKTKGVDLIDTYTAYNVVQDKPWNWAGQVKTADGQTADISGITCSHWLYYGAKTGGGGDTSVSFNLSGKHDTLTFSYYSNKDTTLKVLGDNGSVLGEYNVIGGAVAQTVTIPLFKTSELKFQFGISGGTNASIFDAYLDA